MNLLKLTEFAHRECECLLVTERPFDILLGIFLEFSVKIKAVIARINVETSSHVYGLTKCFISMGSVQPNH